MRQINEAGLDLIKGQENLSLKPYLDVAGIATIGWGHTSGVTMRMAPISRNLADTLLLQDVAYAQQRVEKLINVPLTDNQFASLVSLVFNAGTAPLCKTMGEKLRAKDYEGAASEFGRWIYAGGKIRKGLIRRRAAEEALFMRK